MSAPLDCRLLELDYSGIENQLTGYMMGDPSYIRWARLGLHAAVCAKYLGKPADPTWDDVTLRAYLKSIKHDYPVEYDLIKHVDHGTDYGLTLYGMMEMWPDAFPTIESARAVQNVLFLLAPGLRQFHHDVRQAAKDKGFLGGPIDPKKPWRWAHPFGYRHWFWDVLSYRPTDEVTARRWLRHPDFKDRIVYLHGRPFKVQYGGDSKRVIALFPQGIAAGVLKRAEMRLFHPESVDYIGDAYFGRTPLLVPIHDSLFLIVPCVVFDRVFETAVRIMQEPIPQLPCPPEWGLGPYLRIGVSAQASAPGGNWAPFLSEEAAAEKGIRPNLLGMVDLDVLGLEVSGPGYDAPLLPREEEELELWESLQRVV